MNNLVATRKLLDSGKLTITELTESYLNTIHEKNPEVNAVIQIDQEKVIKRAQHIQKKIDDGTAGSMAGAVIGIKDVICEKGKKVTCSSNILRNFESVYDATVVEKLQKEDALLIARTNMDEFAMGSSTEKSIYGATKNPVNTEYVSGGSSGGSGAAVASDMCNIALGSDTGGSIRQPASYCGVVGLKPTYGRVSRYGLVAFASSFDCIGPFTKNITDAAKLLQCIAGHDPMDQSSADIPVPDYSEEMQIDKPMKIGIPSEYFGEGLDSEIRERINSYLSELEKQGHQLIDISLPHTKYAIATYYILATAEASSNLARYDGIRYGHRADIKEVEKQLKEEKIALEKRLNVAVGEERQSLLNDMPLNDTPLIRLYKQSRTEGFAEEVKRRILLGTYVLSAGYYDAYYAKAQKVRRLIKNDFVNAFEKVDVIASPTAPTTAFKLGENQDDPLQMYLNDIYTISANLAGICGISVPVGPHSNGLPIGMQFMGNSFRESDILNIARRTEEISG